MYIDAEAMLPNIPRSMFPAWSLNCALYLEGGIRGGELGGVMYGGVPKDERMPNGTVNHCDVDDEPELLRLAIPRRVYTESHMRYT